MRSFAQLLRPKAILCLFITLIACGSPSASTPPAIQPCALAAAADGTTLFVAGAGSKSIICVDVETRKITQSFPLPAVPTGIAASKDRLTLVVTCGAPRSRLLVLDAKNGRIRSELGAGHTAMAPVLSRDGRALYICNRFNNDVTAFDLAKQKELWRVSVRREPVAAALTLDGARLLVANHLYDGLANANHISAVISVIDAAQARVIKELSLPNGSGLLTDIAISPDGNHAVVTHVLARYALPTTQLERGWMMTNTKSIIDIDKMEVINTVLLDEIDRGAANPWGVAWSADGEKIITAIAGGHEVSVTSFSGLLDKLSRLAPPPQAGTPVSATYGGPASRVTTDVPNDLSFLHGIRTRRALPTGDLGPRAVTTIGSKAWVANYFSDTLSEIDLSAPDAPIRSIPLGPKRVLAGADLGELYFNDARLCFQRWQSCASCHPGDARVDGLNWDLMNDGMGNPKNNKSLLYAFQTPPAMSIGVREDAAAAVRAGVRHILFTEQTQEVTEALDQYVQSLKPVFSPVLKDGKLSEAARRGKRLYESKKVGCAECHPAPLFTDLKAYDVGTRNDLDREVSVFDTPTLVELWRTAPYLHDGSATLRQVLVEANKGDRHGRTSHLTDREKFDLLEYLLSL